MTLLELLQLCKRSWKLLVALPLVCVLAAAVYCWGIMPDQYTAETSIYALTTSDSAIQGTDTVTSSDMTASQQLANDFAELAANEQIQLAAAKNLGMETLDDFDIKVVSSTTNRVIKLDVTGQDPQACALIANALAKQIGETAVDVMGVEAVNVITEAQTPDEPSGPRRALYAAVALLAGLFVAVALIVLRDMLNTTIRSDEEINELLGLPVIGHIPTDKGGKR